MKRIEFKDLRPGDTFEYERVNRYSRPERQTRRDTVKPIPQKGGLPDIYRSYQTYSGVDGQEIPGTVTLFTEVGQTNHGYVTLAPDAVVVLFEDSDG